MNLIIIATALVLYIFLTTLVWRTIYRIGKSRSVRSFRIKYVSKTLNLALTAVFVAVVFLLLGVEYAQLSLFLSSVFAVVGVGLFAQWSILSNVTASLIIFFAFPYRVGDRIKILDGDNGAEGRVEEITLFHVLVKQGHDIVTYPNTLILQKAVVKLSDKSITSDSTAQPQEKEAPKDTEVKPAEKAESPGQNPTPDKKGSA